MIVWYHSSQKYAGFGVFSAPRIPGHPTLTERIEAVAEVYRQAPLFAFPETKRCSRCRAVKPFEAFGRDRTHRDGLRSRCRSCEHVGQRSWWACNKDRCNSARRERRANDAEYRASARARRRLRRATDPQFRAKERDRGRLWRAAVASTRVLTPYDLKRCVRCRTEKRADE